MSQYFVFSQILKTAQTKKVCGLLTQQSSWRDVMGGQGGLAIQSDACKLPSLSIQEVAKQSLPNAAYVYFRGEKRVAHSDTQKPLTPLGSTVVLPHNIGEMMVVITTAQFEGCRTRFEYEAKNTLHHQNLFKSAYPNLGRQLQLEHSVNLSLYRENNSTAQRSITQQDLVEEMTNQIQLIREFCHACHLPQLPIATLSRPYSNDQTPLPVGVPEGVLTSGYTFREYKKESAVHFTYAFDPVKLPSWQNIVEDYQSWLIKRNQNYVMSASIDYGRMNWFSGMTGCVTPEANELIRRECENPQFESYYLEYLGIESDSWTDREKRRKKVTEPIFQQLGECNLDNDCQLTLRLKIYKEGYVVYLDFPSLDDMIRFSETDIYRMTKWENSVE